MFDRRALSLFVLVFLIAFGSSLAAQRSGTVPDRYTAGLDGRLSMVQLSPQGTTWAAWAYRSGSEYDIAVSSQDEAGSWTDPEFIGAGDHMDQVDPALACDAAGNLYLVYAESQTGRILFTARAAGRDNWSVPSAITGPEERGASPALAVIGGYLVAAFRTPLDTIAVRQHSLAAPTAGIRTHGIQEGPSGIDPLGKSWRLPKGSGWDSVPASNLTPFGPASSGN